MNGGRDKTYNRTKLRLSIAGNVLDLALLCTVAFSPLSQELADFTEITGSVYCNFLLFAAVLGTLLSLAGLPLDFYGSYIIEHRYGLSNQTVPLWIREHLKSLALSLAIGIPLVLAFYFFMRWSGAMWWFYFSLLVFLVSVIIARLAPVVIFPIFYKFTLLDDEKLTLPITSLLNREKVSFSGIYTFNMSRDSRKANAGFAGFGKTRRIILSDTLVNEFTPDEILAVFAHELGHYRKKHILKGIISGGILLFLSFYLCSLAYDMTRVHFGYTTVHEIAAIPILLIYLSITGIILMPLTNYLSRSHEREADLYALEATGSGSTFASALERLADMNLADRNPHPLTEFIFYSHPSIGKRIRFCKEFDEKSGRNSNDRHR